LKNYSVKYLWGYSSSLDALAREALRLGKRLKMQVVIANAEPLYEHQRQVISEAFSCPVRETYGMCEMVAAASECESGHLHLWPEVGLLETSRLAIPITNDGVGSLVSTSLLNADMPLIRYRVGDLGSLPVPGATCPCGRSLPLISSLEGRTDDLLYGTDGRVLGRLDPVFKGNLPIRAAQIIQETLGRVRIRYVPGADFTRDGDESIVDRLQARMGKVEVLLEEVEDIPREANGKFRAVICKLPPIEKKASPTVCN